MISQMFLKWQRDLAEGVHNLHLELSDYLGTTQGSFERLVFLA